MSTAVIFDLDGVLCNLTERLLSAFSARWPDVPLEYPTAWSVRDAYPDLTEEQYSWWAAAYQNPYYYATAQPSIDAEAAVNGARLFHHACYYRSSRPMHLASTTEAWLEEWGFLRPDDPPNAFLCGPTAKEEAHRLPFATLLFVDDDKATVERLARTPRTIDATVQYLLLDRPYNQGALPTSVRRLSSLRDLPLLFGELWQDEQSPRLSIAL